MMNYYWYDHKASNEAPESQQFKELKNLFEATRVKSSYKLQAITGAFICFVHPGNAQGISQSDWETVANATQQRYVALLSFGADPFTTVLNGSVKPLQKDRLRRGLERLSDGPNLFDEFKQNAKNGHPKWELLAPELEAENSIALYLLLLAQKKAISVEVPPGLRAEAYTELQKIGKNHPSCGIELPQKEEDLDQGYLESIGKLLTECVCK
jgi:hypothetical protein